MKISETKSVFRGNLLVLNAFIIKQDRMKITYISRGWKKEQYPLCSKRTERKGKLRKIG